jgi:hypothetical protein
MALACFKPGLSLPRLYRLHRFARNNAIHAPTTGLAAECEAQGTTAGQWRVASRLVIARLCPSCSTFRHRTATTPSSLLLVADALDPLPQSQRRRVAK